MGLTLRVGGAPPPLSAAAFVVPTTAPSGPTSFPSAVRVTGREMISHLGVNANVNASVLFDARLGSITGNACTNNFTAGMTGSAGWSGAFICQASRMTVTGPAGVAGAGGTQQFRANPVDLVRLMEADPPYSTMNRTRFGVYEWEGYLLLDAPGPFAGAWSARTGIFAPRNTAAGVFGQGIVFYASETSPNWRCAIEVKGAPETTQLLLVDVSTGIPFQQQIVQLGIRCGAVDAANSWVEWLVNGTVINTFTGLIATRFQNVGPTVPEAQCPGFSATKQLAADPAINFLASEMTTWYTPGLAG